MKRNALISLLIVTVLCLANAPILAGQTVTTEGVTAEEIAHSLKPKPRTRGLAGPTMNPNEVAFIERMKHTIRGLTVEERTQVATIVSNAALPSIDLEVNFAVNSAALDPTAVATLQKLGAALKSPDLSGGSFLIAGHTDARGAKDYNQKLSEERAKAVKSFLTSNFQMPAGNLLSVGYGDEQLKNTTDPFADENRRVKIVNLAK